MLNVYLATSEALPDAITIIAEDADEAALSFTVWRAMNLPAGDVVHADIVRLSERDLERTPQLAELASSWQSGIARWVGHREGWVVVSPGDMEPAGSLEPPQCPVSCFLFTHEDFGSLHVVAETMERAIATLHLWSLDRNGWSADYNTVTEVSPWQLSGPMMTLREDMFAGKVGVGLECEDGFWRVFPADYTPQLQKRDGSNRHQSDR